MQGFYENLLPPYLTYALRCSPDDLIFFGKPTLQYVIEAWEDWIDGYQRGNEKDRERWSILMGKSAAEIRELARQYTVPELTELDRRFYSPDDSDTSDETLAAVTRLPAGATTLNICGWCPFAEGGWQRLECHTETWCSLQDQPSETRYATTPCFIGTATDAELDETSRFVTDKLAVLEMTLGECNEKLEKVRQLERRADNKPALPRCRPSEWFKPGDEVICYTRSFDESLRADGFVSTTVEWLDRDGAVIVLREGGSYGSMRPEIWHVWEFRYLLDNAIFAQVWADAVTKDMSWLDGKRLMGIIRAAADRL